MCFKSIWKTEYITKYELTSKIITDEDGNAVRVWGILCMSIDNGFNNVMQVQHFDDVSDCCGVTVKIIELLRNYNVCFVHAQQVIEECLADCSII